MSGIIPPVDQLSPISQGKSYIVSTDIYEGPLDLLLQLIEHAELDITKVSLAQVTDQYLARIHTIQVNHPEEVSEFLVIASRLIQIKSEVLLPRPPAREPGEEDPGEALARQLILYKKFKEIAAILEQRESAKLKTYLRLAPAPKLDFPLDLDGLSLEDILFVAQEVFGKGDEQVELGQVVAPLRITIREKIRHISVKLRNNPRISFRELLTNSPGKVEIIITFLAMLELYKRRAILVYQESLFGDIYIQAGELWDENEDFDLEFDE